jgi:DNA-binding response OmpR family regulator
MTESARILIVDDNEMNRDMLARRLERDGHEVMLAESGPQALEYLSNYPVDLMLLDIMMPHMSGYEVLERVKADSSLPYIPVIIISAVSDLNSVVRCIEIGAEDYLFKPFNPILLKARVDASLSRKRLSDWQQEHLVQPEQQPTESSDSTLTGAQQVADASVLLMEVVDIDRIAGMVAPPELVDGLNELFTHVQQLAQDTHMTIARSLAGLYRISSDLPRPQPEHARSAADLALAIQSVAPDFRFGAIRMAVRIGIGSGSLTVGMVKPGDYYDVWGEAMYGAQQAMRMAAGGSIYVTAKTYRHLPADRYMLQSIPGDPPFYELQPAK